VKYLVFKKKCYDKSFYVFCVFAFEFVVVVSYDDSDVVLDAVNVVVVYVDDTAVAAAAAVSLVVVVFVVVNVHLLFVVYAVVNFSGLAETEL